TATAALLGAAAALRDAHPRHDIWLVHLTGEEFDLQEFELHGIPGVLFNEDMDYSDRSSGNPHNHQSTDVASTLDLAFAAAVAKIAIETTLRLAND
ncbi:MAG TPA: hypothetical protein VHT91_12925, partial [Kofleriaceae bacterium]|nr:hypothetical protein [Kofleriaceae bacterium]